MTSIYGYRVLSFLDRSAELYSDALAAYPELGEASFNKNRYWVGHYHKWSFVQTFHQTRRLARRFRKELAQNRKNDARLDREAKSRSFASVGADEILVEYEIFEASAVNFILDWMDGKESVVRVLPMIDAATRLPEIYAEAEHPERIRDMIPRIPKSNFRFAVKKEEEALFRLQHGR